MFRYALLYFSLLILFLVLFVGPSLAGKYIGSTVSDMVNGAMSGLVQPTGQNNNDTIGTTQTGTGAATYTGAGATTAAAASATESAAAKIRLF